MPTQKELQNFKSHIKKPETWLVSLGLSIGLISMIIPHHHQKVSIIIGMAGLILAVIGMNIRASKSGGK